MLDKSKTNHVVLVIENINEIKLEEQTNEEIISKAFHTKETKKSSVYTMSSYSEPLEGTFAADPIIKKMTPEQLRKSIANTTKLMKEAAKNLDFIQAAQYRDEIIRLNSLLDEKNG